MAYHPSGGATVSIEAVFGRDHALIEIGDGAQVETSRPLLQVRLADLAALSVTPARGDHFTIDGTTYVVAEVRDDFEGVADIFAEVA